jgi:hypothetical protein
MHWSDGVICMGCGLGAEEQLLPDGKMALCFGVQTIAQCWSWGRCNVVL